MLNLNNKVQHEPVVVTDIKIEDNTTAGKYLKIDSDSDGTALTADRTLTIDVNNANRTLDLAAHLTLQKNNITFTIEGGSRTLKMYESLTVGDGYDGTITYTGSGKTLTVEDTAVVSQDMTSDAAVSFARVNVGGATDDVDIGAHFDNMASAYLDTDNSDKHGFYAVNFTGKTAAAFTGTAYAVYGGTAVSAANTQNWTNATLGIAGFYGGVTFMETSGTISNAASISAGAMMAGSGTVTNLYGLHVPSISKYSGTLTNQYGLWIDDIDEGATLNYSIHTGAGLVRFGDEVVFSKTAYWAANQTATGDGATTIDWGAGNKFVFTFGAFNETFTFTAPGGPCNLTLVLIQDGTGSRTATWPGTVKWPSNGTTPTLTTNGADVDIVTFFYDGTSYYGQAALDFE